jgi:hypothetical protein
MLVFLVRSMLAALMFLLVVIVTNYAMMAFSCHGLHVYGAWLNKYHRVDLWLLRILVSGTTLKGLVFNKEQMSIWDIFA